MRPFRAPPRLFRHADGRRWRGELEGTDLVLEIADADGDVVRRTRAFADGDLAARALLDIARELAAEGYDDVSVPAWRVFVDELVAHWRADDPAFDAEALRAGLLAPGEASAAEIAERVMALGDRWVAQANGELRLDLARAAAPSAEAAWLGRYARDSLPALLLALRHHDYGAQLQVDALLGELRLVEALPALLSVVEHPTANLASHLGGRPQHIPTFALIRLGRPAPPVVDRLGRALARDDFRVARAAAEVLAEFATDDGIFATLLAHLDRGKREESFAWALMRTAEVRPDPALRPFLEWMARSSRFRSAGYPERIRQALERLPKR